MKTERRLPGQAGVMTALILACVFVSVRAEGLEFPLSGAKEWWKTVTPETIADYAAKGADVSARNENGQTPLHWATSDNPNSAVIDALVRLGADVNARNKRGFTPLHYAAAWNQNPAVIKALVRLGADVNARGEKGRTPLRIAATQNPNPEVIDVLVRPGTDVNARDQWGRTPLHLAAEHNPNPKVIEALLDAGADASLKNSEGKQPADYADENKCIKDSKARWRLHEARSGFKSLVGFGTDVLGLVEDLVKQGADSMRTMNSEVTSCTMASDRLKSSSMLPCWMSVRMQSWGIISNSNH